MEFSYKGIALIPVIAILVDAIKVTGIPKKFLPIISLGIGITFAIIFENNIDVKQRILLGIIMGTSASGIYSNRKEITNGITKNIMTNSKK